MLPCCQSPSIRIEKIRENLSKQQIERAPQQRFREDNNWNEALIPENEMTDVLQNTGIASGAQEIGTDPPDPVDGVSPQLPNVIPNPPTFRVPANPLLPPEYQEILNYNDLQYANGFFRTQIGRYVRAECLVGSNQIISKYGFLIGVGLNYILLQEAATKNVTSVDFWSIRFMYFYYNKEDLKRVMPFVDQEQ